MRCPGYEMARYKGTQASHLWEIDANTMYNQWATAPGRSLNYPRLKSITHLRTFSDNGVYVALQLFLVILVSDQWRRVLIPYSYWQAPWCHLYARGMTLPIYMYMGPTALRGIRITGDTLSNVESQVFTPYNFGSCRDQTPDLLTTRPTCYNLATALYIIYARKDTCMPYLQDLRSSQHYSTLNWDIPAFLVYSHFLQMKIKLYRYEPI